MRLDLAVARRFGWSRRAAREAVRAGRIDVGGQARDEPGAEIAEDAPLTHHPDRPSRRSVRTRLTVLAEDPDFLVVEKPAGLLTVPTAAREKDTLLSRVSAYLQHRYRRRPYVGVVHRLDRETSGVLVFARRREALRFLQERFRRHDVEREYVALVEGTPAETGTFDRTLVGDGTERRRAVTRAGETGGKRAVTRYRLLERFDGASLVSVELETGRTHQIRIHFGAAGHPVVGEKVYRRPDPPAPAVSAPRQMLHARRLAFAHPATGERVAAEAPLPEDFARVLGELRRRRGARPHQKKSAPVSRGARSQRREIRGLRTR